MKHRTVSYFMLTIFMLLFCFVENAYCDMGVPIIFITLPAMVLAFIPICLVEAFVYKKSLGVHYRIALKPSFISNLVSTIIGLPVSWLLLFIIGIGSSPVLPVLKNKFLHAIFRRISESAWKSAWIGGQDPQEFFSAVTICLLASYFASVFIEYQIVKKLFKAIDKNEIKRSTWKANWVTYHALFIIFALRTVRPVWNNGSWIFAICSLTLCSAIASLLLLFSTDKVKRTLIYSNLTLTAALFFTISNLLGLVFSFDGKPVGVVLDQATGVGRLLPDTKWVDLSQKIFYSDWNSSTDKIALYAIDVNGANLTKISDTFSQLGWIPTSEDMFVISDGTLYLSNSSGTTKEKIYSGVNYVEWSPVGDKFYFVTRDEDTNGDGHINWHDSEHVYIFDRKAQTKQRVGFDRNGRFPKMHWNKSGDVLYITYSKALSPNDVWYILCSYHLATKDIQRIGEEKSLEGKHSIRIEDYIEKESLFYNMRIYRAWKETPLRMGSPPKNTNRGNGLIKFFTDPQQSSLYIQRNGQPRRKLFEYKFKASQGFPVVGDLYWLPGNRYVILNLRAYLCVLDTETERIGILTKGRSPIWKEQTSESRIILVDQEKKKEGAVVHAH